MKTYEPIRGWLARRTTRAVVVEIDYFANPNKDEEWAAKVRAKMPSEAAFRREHGRDWTSAAGDAFYPEFREKKERFVHVCRGMLDAPIYRGWDFGWRKAACIWFQYDPTLDRAWILRELMPEQIDTHSFRDLVLYLSGQRSRDSLLRRPRSLAWVDRLEQEAREFKDIQTPPWFESSIGSPNQFIDLSGPEALRTAPEVSSDTAERTSAQILAVEGIHLQLLVTTPKARENLIRRLLLPQPDGYPGLWIDPACPLIIKGMSGGIAFPKKSKSGVVSDKPARDGHFEHLHDAMGYGLTQVVPFAEGPSIVGVLPEPVWEGRVPASKPKRVVIPSKEARRRWR